MTLINKQMENAVVLKSLLELIQGIRTPLMFWTVLLLVSLGAFNIFSKNNEWFRELSGKIIQQLTKAGLYKIVRVFIIMMFTLLIIFIIIAFSAPLLNNWIDKSYGHLGDRIDKLGEKIDKEKKYEQIIKLYEADELEKANKLILETFNLDKVFTIDERHGYVIASYFGSGKFDKAAEEIIKRDLKRPKWNYGLKADLALCIRNFALKNTTEAGIELVKYLKKKHNSKILSVFWTSIPIEIIRNIESGIHNLSYEGRPDGKEKDKKTILYLIQRYPSDPFIDYAYYFLQEYDQALQVKPNSHIREVLLFASGYRISVELNLTENSEFKINKNKTYSKIIDKGIKTFEKFIEEFGSSVHADDAIYYLCRLLIHKGDYERASNLLLDLAEYGNGDFEYYATLLSIDLIKNIGIKHSNLFLNKKNHMNNYLKEYYIKEMLNSFSEDVFIQNLKNISNPDLKAFAYYELSMKKLNEFDFSSASKFAYEGQEHLHENTNEFRSNQFNLYQNYFASILEKCHLMKRFEQKKNLSILDYYLISIDLRKNKGDRLLSDFVIDEGIKYAKDKMLNYDYFLYLRILVYKESDFEKVEKTINEFIRIYSKSEFLDDALAETIYSSAYVFNDFEKAEYYFKKLLLLSPKGNAVDNAYNWLAASYLESCEIPYYYDVAHCISKRKKLCGRSMELYSEIVKKFPYTRFAKWGKSNIIYLNNILPQIEADCNEGEKYFD